MCNPEGLPLFPGSRDDHISSESGVENSLWGLHFWSSELKQKKLSLVDTTSYDGILAHNLLTQMLMKHPSHRPTIARVLSHPFVSRKKVIRLVGQPPVYDIYLCYRNNHNHNHNNNNRCNVEDDRNSSSSLVETNTAHVVGEPQPLMNNLLLEPRMNDLGLDLGLARDPGYDLDVRHVEKLYPLLTAKGYKVYWDKGRGSGQDKDKGSGQDKDKDWAKEREGEHVYEGLANCRVFVPLTSRNAINHPTKHSQNFSKFTNDSPCDQVILYPQSSLTFHSYLPLHYGNGNLPFLTYHSPLTYFSHLTLPFLPHLTLPYLCTILTVLFFFTPPYLRTLYLTILTPPYFRPLLV